MFDAQTIVVIVAIVVCLVVLGVLMALRASRSYEGGAAKRKTADPRKSPHIVVDTLNLAHWLHTTSKVNKKMTPELINATIDQTAPILKMSHVGRVMYVVKDRESVFNDEASRQMYDAAAKRNGVYISVVERYEEPPAGVAPSAEHSARGRDDFYLALLARQWRCAVLTEDRLKDFDRFRATVPPFHVYEYAFWRDAPQRESIRPDSSAYSRLRKPMRIGYETYFESLKPSSKTDVTTHGVASATPYNPLMSDSPAA
jgi:hypothetical protein